eukprot:CAMPEP_0194485824 /NCGR_PEP_ID=MMETSP0253-20130528/6695_1 /TAXON_ID=2966 /ORGANISM="Noctiluca scintillans" /LENGTH=263 /DNA_ID=CAMNT_0039325843 /DNA_START=67 /DNA_END=858 /DNA_ORIENTATION=-
MQLNMLVPLLCGLVGQSAALTIFGKTLNSPSFLKNLAPKQKLRVCNAYPSESGMEVRRGSDQLTSAPIPYKSCQELSPSLKFEDKLDFHVEDGAEGSFEISSVPSSDATMMLVVHRHDVSSLALAFESHVFANVQGTQVAVLDAYAGTAKAKTLIQAPRFLNGTRRGAAEELEYQNVVSVNPGNYEVELEDTDGKAESTHKFAAKDHETYIVARVGAELTHGGTYHQELMVFPSSDQEHSGTSQMTFGALSLALASLVATVSL